MPVDISIVILNYNTFDLTANCIRSIYEHTKKLTVEVIVVDNGSAERNPDDFLRQFPGIVLKKLPENVGFSRGNNIGIEVASADVVLLLNSDILVIDDAIEKVYSYFQPRPDLGMIGCKLLNEDGSEQLSSFVHVQYPLLNLWINSSPIFHQIARFFPSLDLYANYFEFVKRSQQKTHSCAAIGGAFMMFRRSTLSRYGFLDPDFFLYCEDTEWCRNRILKHHEIVYYSEAAVIHLSSRSSPSHLVEKQSLLSSFLYAYKLGTFNYLASLFIYITSSLLNLLLVFFMKKINRRKHVRLMLSFIALMPIILFNIPKFRRAFGSRTEPLRIREYRRH
jgi:GT2 family glycosyltransferase